MLRNDEMSDRELLLVINDCCCLRDGYTTSAEVAEALGLRDNGKSHSSPAGVASCRLAHMARADKGYLERLDPKLFGLPKNERLWAITEHGKNIMRGRITASVTKVIANASPGDHVAIMRELSRTAFVGGSLQGATAVRREWQHNYAQRSR